MHVETLNVEKRIDGIWQILATAAEWRKLNQGIEREREEKNNPLSIFSSKC